MLGAVVGDIVGSVYEWHNVKRADFPLFSRESKFTDDTVMTVAIAEALLATKNPFVNRAAFERGLIETMQAYGRRYPRAGYGGSFRKWLRSSHPAPYGSWGNGSAMRVSPVAWVAESLEQAELLAVTTAQVTHNHPSGIKGAQAIAACVFLARAGARKDEIRAHAEAAYGYDLEFSLDDIRETYSFDVSCDGSVPQAIVAFLEGGDFEDVIRRAVSIGGDSDTIAAMAGGIAHAYYGIPSEIWCEASDRLDVKLNDVIADFRDAYVGTEAQRQ